MILLVYIDNGVPMPNTCTVWASNKYVIIPKLQIINK